MNTDHPSPTPSEAVAAAVRTAMDKAGVSQVDLAMRAGIPRVTLIRRLAGHTSFTIAELTAIADALAVPLASLLPTVSAA